MEQETVCCEPFLLSSVSLGLPITATISFCGMTPSLMNVRTVAMRGFDKERNECRLEALNR